MVSEHVEQCWAFVMMIASPPFPAPPPLLPHPPSPYPPPSPSGDMQTSES